MEETEYNLLLRWFSGRGGDDPAWGEGRPERVKPDGIQQEPGVSAEHGDVATADVCNYGPSRGPKAAIRT